MLTRKRISEDLRKKYCKIYGEKQLSLNEQIIKPFESLSLFFLPYSIFPIHFVTFIVFQLSFSWPPLHAPLSLCFRLGKTRVTCSCEFAIEMLE